MTDNIRQDLQANNKEEKNKKLNIAKMIKKMDKPKEHYTKEEMEELEDFAKRYKEFINKAKDRNKKYAKTQEKNRRTHQMCEFGGEIEKVYKELFDRYYWTEENKYEIANMLKMIKNYYANMKAKENQPTKKENPQPSQNVIITNPQTKTAP